MDKRLCFTIFFSACFCHFCGSTRRHVRTNKIGSLCNARSVSAALLTVSFCIETLIHGCGYKLSVIKSWSKDNRQLDVYRKYMNKQTKYLGYQHNLPKRFIIMNTLYIGISINIKYALCCFYSQTIFYALILYAKFFL